MHNEQRWNLSRWVTALLFIAAGANHFWHSAFYERIIPPHFPDPAALVLVSGFFEILGGLGLLVRPLRRWAGSGLILLLIAVFPANIYMALEANRFADLHLPRWTYWLRLPLQGLIAAWVWRVSRQSPKWTKGK
jgi:uncharacterized membrane protein